MPPRARPLRKGSTASRSPAKDVSEATSISQAPKPKSPPKVSSKMPPPPPPVPTTILGPEMQALGESLKDAAFHTGRIFRFYSDARKQRIVAQAPYPPRSLARDLGRSLERYDQICDTVETQLLHAISIFERDLKAEQARVDAEASASVATRTRSKRPSLSPTASRIPLPNMSPPPPGSEQPVLQDSPTSMFPPSQFPPSGASAISIAPRRQSAIFPSLHRPSFPLKLDLSPAALAGNVDSAAMGPPMDVNVDLGLTSLPSPVTLVPKTARALPNDPTMPDIFGVGSSQSMSVNAGDGDVGPMSGSIGMKTTGTAQEDVIDLTVPEASAQGAPELGDSADKPIELDLEGSYDDLFGDVETRHDSANSANSAAGSSAVPATSTQLEVDMEELFTPQDNQTNAFQLDGSMGQNGAAPDPGAILASLASRAESAHTSSNDLSALLPGGQSGNGNADGLPGHGSGDTFAGLGTGEAQFDLSAIDLSSFSGLFDSHGSTTGEGAGVGGDEMDLMSLLAMDGGESANPSGPTENTST